MFRAVLYTAVCIVPLAMSAPAGAQSYVSVPGQADMAASASSAPVSLMLPYAPRAEAPRGLGLLVGEDQRIAQPAPVAGVSVTSGTPADAARMAVNELAAGRSMIAVSTVRGARE